MPDLVSPAVNIFIYVDDTHRHISFLHVVVGIIKPLEVTFLNVLPKHEVLKAIRSNVPFWTRLSKYWADGQIDK
jgi:hypothetical protein